MLINELEAWKTAAGSSLHLTLSFGEGRGEVSRSMKGST